MLRNRLARPWTLPPIGDDGLREVIGGPARLAGLDVSEVQEAVTDYQRTEHPRAQPPVIGMPDVGDPAANAGVQLREADLPREVCSQPGAHPVVGVAHLTRLHEAMGWVDDKAEGDTGACRQHLRARIVDNETQAGEALDDGGLPGPELSRAVAEKRVDVTQIGRVRCADQESAQGTPHDQLAPRAYLPGGTFFFTLVTYGRAPILTTTLGRSLLRQVTMECRRQWPFHMVAVVLMPDHLHALWRLPEGDTGYSKRWGWLKKELTKRWLAGGGAECPVSESRCRNRRSGVWQRRFWEHVIRDEGDLERHLDDIHYNPVKHGLVRRAIDWPWSSFHRFVRAGQYPVDWGCGPMDFDDIVTTVGE